MRRVAAIGAFGNTGVVVSWIATLICAIFFLITVWVVLERRQVLHDHGSILSANLVHVLQEQTARSVQAIDITLTGVVEHLRFFPDMDENDPRFRRFLREKISTLPYVRELFVTDANGVIIHDTDYRTAPSGTLADDTSFSVPLDGQDVGLRISGPLLSRSTNTWFIALSRRIEGADGELLGVAVAAMDVPSLQSFYSALQLNAKDTISLFLRDGTLLLRKPHAENAMGRSFADVALFRSRLPASETGTYRSPSLFDGSPRIVSYRALEDYPLVVTVGLDERTVLARWWWNMIGAYIAGMVAAIIMIGLAGIYMRYRRNYEIARDRHLAGQRLEILGQMTGGIAHDFNNLLAIVIGGLRLLRRSQEKDGKIPDHLLSQIEDAVGRGTNLCSQLLMFAKRGPVRTQVVNPNEALSRLHYMLQQAAGSMVTVVEKFAPDLWECRLDPVQFDSAILNLVVNARDAMPNGGRIEMLTRNVQIAAHHPQYHVAAGDYVEVTVRDDGAGMPSEVVRHAHEPFFTTKEDRGTGLGLSQVHGFARQLGGDMLIESAFGSGTSVSLLFPRSKAPPAPVAVCSSPVSPEPRSEPLAPRSPAPESAVVDSQRGSRGLSPVGPQASA